MKTILLVDDKIQLLALLKQILKSRYDVVLKYNGLEAIEWIQQGNLPDLILTDIQMPKMNGYEATNAIRESDHLQAKTIPIIALSANAFTEDVQKSLRAGMNAHLAKPIEPNMLYESIFNLTKLRE